MWADLIELLEDLKDKSELLKEEGLQLSNCFQTRTSALTLLRVSSLHTCPEAWDLPAPVICADSSK